MSQVVAKTFGVRDEPESLFDETAGYDDETGIHFAPNLTKEEGFTRTARPIKASRYPRPGADNCTHETSLVRHGTPRRRSGPPASPLRCRVQNNLFNVADHFDHATVT